MSQKKVKGVRLYLSTKEVSLLEDLLAKTAHFKGGFSKLKKSEVELWHMFHDICKELKLCNFKVKIKLDKSLH
jgi:hypothetical protein